MNTTQQPPAPPIPYPIYGRFNELAFLLDRTPLTAADRMQAQENMKAALGHIAQAEAELVQLREQVTALTKPKTEQPPE